MKPSAALVPIALVVGVVVFAGCVGPQAAPEAPHPEGVSQSPYVDLLTAEIRALKPEEVDMLRNGTGGGLALPAELNGYPGPKHVLELDSHMQLTQWQRGEVTRLYDAMRADAQRIGREILAMQVDLELEFRDGTIHSDALTARVMAISEAYGELRLVHLRAHLATMDVLTHAQVAKYQELRGYGAGDAAAHAHQDGHGASHE